MIRLIKAYWLPVVVLFVIFFDELFNCFAIVKGFTVDTGMKQYEAMLLAVIGYLMMGYDIIKGRIKKRELRTLIMLFTILLLYIMTSLFYGNIVENYTSYLLVFGSECIPAAYVGIRLAKSDSLQRINNLLPWAVFPISLLIGSIGLTAAMMDTMVTGKSGIGVDAGLNYQSISYFMAFCYTYAFYCLFFCTYQTKRNNVIINMLISLDMFFCASICLMSGGRGAFVYIVAISFFMLFYFIRSSNKHKFRALFITFFLIIVSLILISYFGIMESAGMKRVTSSLTEDNERVELYLMAYNAFLSSPIIGCGVGSIWWTVGYYCHNVILDLLAETGLVGTTIVLFIIWKTIVKLYKLSFSNKIYLFLLFVLAGGLCACMFSGYWIAAFKVYFVCSFVFCLPKHRVVQTNIPSQIRNNTLYDK